MFINNRKRILYEARFWNQMPAMTCLCRNDVCFNSYKMPPVLRRDLLDWIRSDEYDGNYYLWKYDDNKFRVTRLFEKGVIGSVLK